MEHGTITNPGPGVITNTYETGRTLSSVRKKLGYTETTERSQINDDVLAIKDSVTAYIDACGDVIKDISECFSIIINGNETNNLSTRFSDLQNVASSINTNLDPLKNKLFDFIKECYDADLADLDKALKATIQRYKSLNARRYIQDYNSETTNEGRAAYTDVQEAKSKLASYEKVIHDLYDFYRSIGLDVPEKFIGLGYMEGQYL